MSATLEFLERAVVAEHIQTVIRTARRELAFVEKDLKSLNNLLNRFEQHLKESM